MAPPGRSVERADLARPRRVALVEQHQLADETLLYLPDAGTIVVINGSARMIWDLCDGARTVRDIVDEILERLELADLTIVAALDRDVRTTVAELSGHGLLGESRRADDSPSSP